MQEDNLEVACSLRLVHKLTAKLISNRATVRISQPAPIHAFSQDWTKRRALHALFLALVAVSGCLPNLELAVHLARCDLTESAIPWQPLPQQATSMFANDSLSIDAVYAPNIWPQQPGPGARRCAPGLSTMTAPGTPTSGPSTMTGPGTLDILCTAAQGGHPELMAWLLAHRSAGQREPTSVNVLLAAVEGCSLVTCQQLYREWVVGREPGVQQWT